MPEQSIQSTDEVKEYEIHFNFGRPFRVAISGLNVVVYDNEVKENKVVYQHEVERVFIGKSPLCPTTEYLHTHGPEFDGNTILLDEGHGNYIHISKNITRFRPRSRIVDFVSTMGNNDLPYPHAKDAHGRFYLLLERVIVEHIPEQCHNQVYDWFYDHSFMLPRQNHRSSMPPTSYPYEGFKGSLNGEPIQRFSVYWKAKPNENMTDRQIKIDDQWHNVDTEEMKVILDRFARTKGFAGLDMELVVLRH